MKKAGTLRVGEQNEIYWEAEGNPAGTPVVFLHGGPGGECSGGHVRHFDLSKYWVISFDQRGCGRSRPLVNLENLHLNTSQALIRDIEALREYLEIEKWALFGTSWGTCLSLIYAQAHPERVEKIVLGAVHLPTPSVVRWITEEMQQLYPQEWEVFAQAFEVGPGDSVIEKCYSKVTDPSLEVREQAAKDWCAWEDVHMSLDPNYKPFDRFGEPLFRQTFATLVIHYWKHSGFIGEEEFFQGIEKISHLPCTMIHGRLDVSSPLYVAWKIHKLWPGSELIVVSDEGHGGPKMGTEMTKAFS